MKVHISKLTCAQRAEVADEARRQLNKLMPMVVQNVEAIILWQLHEEYGFGKRRLMRFFDATAPMMEGMLSYYNFKTDEDAIWLCKHNLKELGIDLDALKGPFYGKLEVDIK